MNFESYIIRDGKRLRRGYTTGSSATGAAKAATKAFFGGENVGAVTIDTPAGIELNLKIVDLEVDSNYASASVIKDGGDDPDVTHSLKIEAKVEEIENGIEILGGKGVGVVTRPGLAVEVGKAAINPVPYKTIKDEVSKVLPSGKGVRVTVEVPKGEEVAQKTLNPKLGIEGGISILGTTGIVEPMSERAYKDSLALKIDQAVALGEDEVVLVFGNYGIRKAKELGYKEEIIVRTSNFVGFMLDYAVSKGIKRVMMVGHIGKLVKVGGGIFNTHSKVADGRLEIIAAYTASLGGSQELVNRILGANTSEEAVSIIKGANFEQVFDFLAERVAQRAKEYVKGELEVGSLLFTMDGEVLGVYRVQ